MISVKTVDEINIDAIPIDSFWNIGNEKENRMHHIHAYPAKFPAFITSKALEYVAQNDFYPEKIADIFCGCGTTAFESRRNNIDFWGCDINPVATLIAKVKSETYQTKRLNKYYNKIKEEFCQIKEYPKFENALPRLKYWYSKEQYDDLSRLKTAIVKVLPKDSKYKLFFLCAFSNILKPASMWLTKSIKPQFDPDKVPQNVVSLFEKQCFFMIKANGESNIRNSAKVSIRTQNFLNKNEKINDIDMIITSPPYVTSYEYADLHQLSTLWLGYTEDYRTFRNGTIGSDYYKYDISDTLKKLNSSGSKIVESLFKVDKAKAKSVAKYFTDMQDVAEKAYGLLSEKGYALFVIGNTEYKSVRIDNATHLSESLLNSGFNEVQITKRKISNKILTPYRDKRGKFSSDSNGRKIYNEEFIVIGKK